MASRKELLDELAIVARRRNTTQSDLLEKAIRREIDGDPEQLNPFTYEDGVNDAAEIVRDGMKQHHWYNHILKTLGVKPRVNKG